MLLGNRGVAGRRVLVLAPAFGMDLQSRNETSAALDRTGVGRSCRADFPADVAAPWTAGRAKCGGEPCGAPCAKGGRSKGQVQPVGGFAAAKAPQEEIRKQAEEVHRFATSHADEGVFLVHSQRLSLSRKLRRYGIQAKE